ncbi:FecR family protein [Chitinophaga sp. GCM10012297]|uniref:FecR domain-containing protein n=1 Tax=Chitinophaga chungangae TaxID=2821488 RepID=A0ABS3YHU4_9BACT|nr:FecR domain-containing protein [Chitinophaga chungangae]MBO9154256.1 FecR domain-containing protein [Chitinophaga chungangae]
METHQIRQYLRQMAAGKLEPEKEDLLLEVLASATEAQLEEIYPASEFADVRPVSVSRRELDKAYHKVTGARRTPLRYLYAWRAACAVLALVVSGFLYRAYRAQQPGAQLVAEAASWNTFSTAEGETKLITLADQSRIYLNGASELKIPATFNAGKREVRLLKGEAFLVVHQDAGKPFVAQMGAVQVNVLGTSFNLRNYPGEQESSVSVQTGKVAMQLEATGEALILAAGRKGIFNKQRNSLAMAVNAGKPGSWTKREFYFDDAPLRDVFRDLQYTYGLRFEVEDKRMLDRPVKATFRQQQPEEIVRILSLMGQFRYTMKDSLVIVHK